jgi:hypothetical protein
MIEYISTNGANILAVLVALMAAAKVVVRLTPSVKDDAILIPNYGSEKKE